MGQGKQGHQLVLLLVLEPRLQRQVALGPARLLLAVLPLLPLLRLLHLQLQLLAVARGKVAVQGQQPQEAALQLGWALLPPRQRCQRRKPQQRRPCPPLLSTQTAGP